MKRLIVAAAMAAHLNGEPGWEGHGPGDDLCWAFARLNERICTELDNDRKRAS